MGDIQTTKIFTPGEPNVDDTDLNAIIENATLKDGVVTEQKVAADAISTVKVKDKAISYGKLQDMVTARILGRLTAGGGVVEELTAAQVKDFVVAALAAGDILLSKLPTLAQGHFLGRKTTGTGAVEDLTADDVKTLLSLAKANWTQSDSNAADYIQNKPTLGALASLGIGTGLTSSGGNLNVSTPSQPARAWVAFKGSDASIYASSNVTSVTRHSAGDYTLNFTSPMTDANYVLIGSATWNGLNRPSLVGPNIQRSKTTTACPVLCMQASANTLQDTDYIYVAIFGN